MPRLASVLVALVLVAACGDDDDATSTGSATTATTAGTSTSTTGSTTTTGQGVTTSTTAPVGPAAEDLPGERIEIFPYADDELAVVGVEADDTLNIRSGPGTEFDVVAELDPAATGVVATGHNRSLEGSGFWAEVTAQGRTGWANTAYLAHLGDTRDVTSEIAADPARLPRAGTMLDLGTEVAELRAPTDVGGGPTPDIVVVDGPHVGDLGEITIDVVGLADDAVLGERLRIFGQPDPGGESFTLRTVEATTLCRRGVTDDRLCV